VKHGRPSSLTAVDEDSVDVVLGADGPQDEAAGRPEDQGGEQDACAEHKHTHVRFRGHI